MRPIAVFAAFMSMALPAWAYELPAYQVSVSLSEKAQAKLTESGEMVHVAAYYYGEAKREEDGDEVGEIQLGDEGVDLPGAGTVSLGKAAIDAAKLAKIKEPEPVLLINVFTSRKVFEDNLLSCDIFQDVVSKAAIAPISIPCKLIGE